MDWPTCRNFLGDQDFQEIDIRSLMKSEKDMNACENFVSSMPTEKLVVVGSLPIGMPLYGSDADNFVQHNTTSFAIGAVFVVFCKTKLCDSRPVECANGEPFQCKQLGNPDVIPVTHIKVGFEMRLAVKHEPQEHISKFQ